MTDFSDEQLHAVLRSTFGHDDFRTGQLPIVRAVLSGRPLLAVMPTGSGKSLCYQLPALVLDGTALVVSPLVALMKDQVDGLRARGVAAVCIHGAQTQAARAEAEEELESGRCRLVYVAPERLRTGAFRARLARLRLSLVAIDEAHCVSEWGHAFRPDYALLGDVLRELRPARIVALTATASEDVRRDIVGSLGLRNPQIVVAGFDRANLHMEVHGLATEAEKRDSLVSAVRSLRPAIVYSATRRQAERMAQHLVQNGIAAAPYHAGLDAHERQAVQERFVRGELPVVTATNAFGLGIDKPDVRLVVHTEIPRSLESYYQEIGRAGRDAGAAVGALFFAPRDIFLQRRLLDLATPRPVAVQRIVARLQAARGPVLHEDLAGARGTRDRMEALAAIGYLESTGLLRKAQVHGPIQLRVAAGDAPPDSRRMSLLRALGGRTGSIGIEALSGLLGACDAQTLETRLREMEQAGEIKRLRLPVRTACQLLEGARLEERHLRWLRVRYVRERARLERMIQFASAPECRRRTLLAALGERYDAPNCGACDVCAGTRVSVVRSRLASALHPERTRNVRQERTAGGSRQEGRPGRPAAGDSPDGGAVRTDGANGPRMESPASAC